MATINNIIDRLAIKVGNPFDHTTKELLRSDILDVASLLIRRTSQRYFVDDFVKIPYFAEVTLVDSLDNCLIESGCKTLKRTVNKVPFPVRIHRDVPFDFVGTTNNSPYMYVRSGGEIKVAKSIPLRSKVRMYFVENLHIYLYNFTKEKYIKVISAFSNPEEVLEVCNSEDCITGNMELPLPYDIIAGIVDTVATMYLNNPKYVLSNKEIETNDTNRANIQGE